MANNSTSKLRVWTKDDFDDCADADERFDQAWRPPDRVGHGFLSVSPTFPQSPVEDIGEAARLYADHFHATRGWEWSWPLDFVVFDGEKYFVVEVERHTVPEFEAGEPRELVVAGGCSSTEVAK